MKTFISDLSGTEFPIVDRIAGSDLQPALLAFIQQRYPSFSESACLSLLELNQLRKQFVAESLEHEVLDLERLHETVVNAFTRDGVLTNELENDAGPPLTTGQRIADVVATFGGSWRFLISFGVFLLVWIVVNAVLLGQYAFDIYPFILLNLLLSCLAAIQAPIIMMSQNRQEEKDRERSRKDYMINLKSELEIRTLHDKVDHLILHQQRKLLDIQKMQVDMMNEILTKLETAANENLAE
jgi:uncharacterized membrane protein